MRYSPFLLPCLLFISLFLPAPVRAQTNMTASIVNNSFEQNGLAGWEYQGFWVQNNTATTTQGWSKTGAYYAETWVGLPATVADGFLMQTVEGLDEGLYTNRQTFFNHEQMTEATLQTLHTTIPLTDVHLPNHSSMECSSVSFTPPMVRERFRKSLPDKTNHFTIYRL